MFVPYFKKIYMLCKIQPLSSIITRRLHKHAKSLNAEKLNNRKVVRISGESSFEFLQGLITNDMRNLQNGSDSIYTMFLNNKGRVLYDAIIFKVNEKNTFLLDCDSECTEQLVKHLKLYKVRRKIDIIPVDSEYCVWSIYDTNLIESSQNIDKNNYSKEQSKLDVELLAIRGDIMSVDPRLAALGYRGIIRSDENVKLPLNDKYKIFRYKLGVGEGVDEFEIGQCFPLEVNCDYLNGVSFDKGCYIGQELTARTFHTGVVRKRLMPLLFDSKPNDVPHNTTIDDPEVSRRTPIGKIKGYCENYGLGIMRVSETLKSKSLKMLEFVCKASVPYWWPPDSVQQQYVKSNK